MEITIEGLDKLYRKLDRIEQIQDVLTPPMQRAVLRMQRDLAQYPPQRPTTYRRTGRLGRSWTTRVEAISGGVQGKIGNNVSYGPFVQSAQFQAWMHKGHWQTDEQVLEDNMPAIQRDFDVSIQAALDE